MRILALSLIFLSINSTSFGFSASGGTGTGECDASICVGDAVSCTIKGTHQIQDKCVYDFGNAAITIDSKALLTADSNTVTIKAGQITLNGEVNIPMGSLELDSTSSITVSDVGGRHGAINMSAGEVKLAAVGDVNISGSGINTDDVDNAGTISVGSFGSITIASPLSAQGINGGMGDNITLAALGDISILAGVLSNGDTDQMAGDITIIGSTVHVFSTGLVQAYCNGPDGLTGTVTIGPACSVIVDGTVDVMGNDTASGSDVFIEYRGGTSVSGSLFTTTDSGGVTFKCRDDGSGQCASLPQFSGSQKISPPDYTLKPTKLDACSPTTTGGGGGGGPGGGGGGGGPGGGSSTSCNADTDCHAANACFVGSCASQTCFYSKYPLASLEGSSCNLTNLTARFTSQPLQCSKKCQKGMMNRITRLKRIARAAFKKQNDHACNMKKVKLAMGLSKKLNRLIQKLDARHVILPAQEGLEDLGDASEFLQRTTVLKSSMCTAPHRHRHKHQ